MPADTAGDWGFCLPSLASAVLDEAGRVVHWSSAAAALLALDADEVLGRPATELLAPGEHPECTPAGLARSGEVRARLRHGGGGAVEVFLHATEAAGEAGGLVLLGAPAESAAECGQGVALLRALLAQDHMGVAVHDAALRVLSVNEPVGDIPMPKVSVAGPAGPEESGSEPFEDLLRQVLETGRPVIDEEQHLYVHGVRRTVAHSVFPLEHARGHRSGVLSIWRDTTEQERARRHLHLLHESAIRISATLDISQAARDLADVLVPGLGDFAAVELAEAVLVGDEPPKLLGGGSQHLVRAAGATADGDWPEGMLPPGAVLPPLHDDVNLRMVQRGEATVTDLRGAIEAVGEQQAGMLIPDGGHSLAVVPLWARGLLLGHAAVWRIDNPEPFSEEERTLLTAICSRAALTLDNARRFQHEHRAAVTLQQRLLPQGSTDSVAVETTGSYRPARSGGGISGDWFDVIPLPGLRVALVVGDVIGHGLAATAAMGRLRAAVQTLAAMELDPDDLLHRVDDLVEQLAAEARPDQQDTVGATCLVAVYDPVQRRCTMASAGHPPPLLIAPDGSARLVEVPPGPPLGVGGMPFETRSVDVEPGSILALYTDGLLKQYHGDDLDAGIRRLADASGALPPSQPLEEISANLLGHQEDDHADDIALLVARTRAVPRRDTVLWEYPAEAAAVGEARSDVLGQLASWGLDETAFTTELIISELVTNAVRYGGGPVSLRLIRAPHALICEVSDASNTQPRLRRAEETDEGGRGLWLVAQMATRWGSRYRAKGKTIWTEQAYEGLPFMG
ncbi:SpoIIE family protein phosphatase [Streptomyces sp. NPDC006784]|uniref:ATP-binding SpoIIE family protein phosphatase n=1 Tax=Streptomyces sp. NPDC006784 TaxID=3364764 RepID=UPI003677556A